MSAKTRMTVDLAWTLLLCVLIAGVLLVMGGASRGVARMVLFGSGAAVLLLAAALYRLHNWARYPTAALFFLFALLKIGTLLLSGFSLGGAFWAGALVWRACYLLSPSTKDLFVTSQGVRLDFPHFFLFATSLTLLIAGLIGMIALDVPSWVVITLLVAGGLLYAVFEEPIMRRVNAWVTLRPPDLGPEAWKTFRRARQARLRGELVEAEAIAAAMPASASADLLRAVIRLDLARAGGGLRRVVFDATWSPPAAARGLITAEAADCDLVALVDERTWLVDALFEDAARSRPVMAEELEPLMEVLTGEVFVNNAEVQFLRWWQERRPHCTGGAQLAWLVARLGDDQCIAAAELAARRTNDPVLVQVAALSSLLENAVNARVSPVWTFLHRDELAVHPLVADTLGLLYLDAPALRTFGHEWAARRVRERLRLVGHLIEMWDRYPEQSLEIRYLLSQLTGFSLRFFRMRPRFDAWWLANAPAQGRHDDALAAALEAAGRGDWEEAEQGFREAHAAWPTQGTSAYNRAVALMELKRYREAEQAFLQRAQAEPEQHLYWTRIGDCRRLDGRDGEAADAYAKSQELGGPEAELVLRRAVSLAADRREGQAAKVLDAAIGPNPDAATLEAVAGQLESEGAFGLARQYQERAFYQSLGSKDETDDEDAEPAGA